MYACIKTKGFKDNYGKRIHGNPGITYIPDGESK